MPLAHFSILKGLSLGMAVVLAGCITTPAQTNATDAKTSEPTRVLDKQESDIANAVTTHWRYECANTAGVQGVDVAYKGPSPSRAAGAVLHLDGKAIALQRSPNAAGVLYVTSNEQDDYRWLVGEDGQGALRVRAAQRGSIEMDVLAQCRPLNSPQG